MIEAAVLSSGDELSALIAREINGQLYGRVLTLDESLDLLRQVQPDDVIRLAGQLTLITSYVLTKEGQT
jgi:hypothetical protein